MEQNNGQTSGFSFAMKVVGECFRRSITPFFMYMMMSFLMLACWMIPIQWLSIVLIFVCLAAGMAYNFYLTYTSGKEHWDAYSAGKLHRQNALLGIESGKNHRVEREYRFWKGIIIGFFVGVPVIIFSLCAGLISNDTFSSVMAILLIFGAGWSIIPIAKFLPETPSALGIGGNVVLFSMLMVFIPMIVSAVSYVVGATVQRRKKEAEKARMDRVRELAEEAAKNKRK